MRFIKLTLDDDGNGPTIFVDPRSITAFYRLDDVTRLYVGEERFLVIETPEEVGQKIEKALGTNL